MLTPAEAETRVLAAMAPTVNEADSYFEAALRYSDFVFPIFADGGGYTTQFILSKLFLQTRYRYDAADIVHVILVKHDEIDWEWLLSSMELYWEVLLINILNFRFVYPSERHLVPRWLMEELLERLNDQMMVKPPGKRVCRGRIFSPRDYGIDVEQWGFSEAVGNLEEQYDCE